jgi:phage terminase large subunit-like protein
VFTVHDELGQVKGPRSELYEALETASGAHDEPLSVIISTQAPTDADLLSVLIEDAQKGADPKVKLAMFSAPDDLDPFSKEAITAANPAFGDFQNADETLAMAEDARRMPSRENEYRNLILNQRVDKNSPFISRAIWQANGGEPATDWAGAPVYAGLDLSSTADLTAFVPICHVDGAWETRPTFWLPGQGLAEKSRADRVPYDQWAKEGFLEAPDSRSIEYEYVARWIYDFCQTENVRRIAFDRWGMKYLRPWLLQAGFTEERLDDLFVEFGQGFQSMSPALRDLESVLLNGSLRHGGHPVLTMCAANAVVTSDPAGGRKLNRPRRRAASTVWWPSQWRSALRRSTSLKRARLFTKSAECWFSEGRSNGILRPPLWIKRHRLGRSVGEDPSIFHPQPGGTGRGLSEVRRQVRSRQGGDGEVGARKRDAVPGRQPDGWRRGDAPDEPPPAAAERRC